MPIARHSHRELEAETQGRKAFWNGRPIWTNPLTGGSARDWTAGWKQALGELAARFNGRILSAAESTEWNTVLALYCPDDVDPTPRRRSRRPAIQPAQTPAPPHAIPLASNRRHQSHLG